MKHTKKTRKSKSVRHSKRSKHTRRYKQRGGDVVSWTPQTDRHGDPDAIGQTTENIRRKLIAPY